jgi:hypothetical protein
MVNDEANLNDRRIKDRKVCGVADLGWEPGLCREGGDRDRTIHVPKSTLKRELRRAKVTVCGLAKRAETPALREGWHAA